MADNYSAVEISTEEQSSLTQADVPKTEVAETPPTEEVTETNEVEGLEIDGEMYSFDDISKWKSDSDNKESWQKSNTEKAQSLSKWNKLTQKVAQDSEFKSHIKDYFYDNPEEANKLGLDLTEGLPSAEEHSPEESPINHLEERLNALEVDKKVDILGSELESIEQGNPSVFKTEQDSLEFLEFVDENNITNLETGFKLWSFDKVQDELNHFKKLNENKERSQKAVINDSGIGASEVKQEFKPTNYKDISLDNPEVAKYFR